MDTDRDWNMDGDIDKDMDRDGERDEDRDTDGDGYTEREGYAPYFYGSILLRST
jgi:hypothetical protein